MPELLGYARVSTTEQNADLQRDALTAGGCWKVFTDHVTGTRERRPEWCGGWTGWAARCGT